jgi:hypothetical protein
LPASVSLLSFTLTIIGIVVDFLIYIFAELLSVASDPKHSPYTYAFAMLSLCVAFAKLVYEWI